jgi:glycerophosphoryl diester phosphodiesterase
MLILTSTGCSSKRTVEVIAHRGGSRLAPENTLAAFQNAIDLGVDMIEIDVEQTSDSVVVVIHDSKVDRTTNGKGSVDSLSFDYIRTLDAGSRFDKSFENEKIPTLDEVLDLINGKVKLLIEIKEGSERYPEIEQKTVNVVQNYNAYSWVIVQSFNKKAIDRVRRLDKGIKTFYLLGRNFDEYYAELRSDNNPELKLNYDGIAVHHSKLSPESVDSVKQFGLEVYTWTVDEVDEMKKMMDAGVDGIITDSPDKLINLLESGIEE